MRAHHVRGAVEPDVSGAHGMVIHAQVHLRAQAERQGPARGRPARGQQEEGGC
jgi:hypothetical protein